MMPCCPFFSRCLLVGLLAAPLLIVAISCSPPANTGTSPKAPASKDGPSSPMEPIREIR